MASVAPQQCQPNIGLVMTNDVSNTNPEEVVPCIALSKNDSYVMSACGGKVSLLNMMTFKQCIWNTNSWEKKKSNAIQLPIGKATIGDTRVQYLRCLTLPCPSLPNEKACVFRGDIIVEKF
ncbi:topless-related protein 2-like isoform X2 [Dioscorea cayenensis subsp. rotundata]|nr:topless-related protein 2-like isoform X2 [Dioscorea cayenensis subsp. rotundata]